MIAVIAFLSSTLFFSPVICLLILPVVVFRLFRSKGKLKGMGLDKLHLIGFWLLSLSVVLGTLVFLMFDPVVSNFEKSILGAIPYVGLIFLSVLVASFFDEGDAKWLLMLIGVEICFGAAEFALGVHSFFSVSFLGETQIGDTDALYYNRVFGLSENSSVYAYKVLMGLVALMIMKPVLNKKVFLIYSVLIVLGFVTSFNRTAILAAIIGLVIFNLNSIRGWLVIAGGCALVLIVSFEYVLLNLTRGSGTLDFSGRDYIFPLFYSILEDNPLFGNAARKAWIDIGGKLYHAHNSYLEFVASNGLLVSAVFFAGYYLLVIRSRLVFALPVLIYSTFQYGILWGFVFHDIAFLGLMFYVLKIKVRKDEGNCGEKTA